MNLKDYPILYVDDERSNRLVMQHNLGDQFALLMAADGPSALQILGEQPIAVLLTDYRMPGMTGVELAALVLERFPDVIRIIITGYSDSESTVEAINRARVQRFIKKPWTREELSAVLVDSVRSWRDSQLVKRLQGQLVELDRVTSLAIMATSVAHDLRQPLAYMGPSVELAQTEIAELLTGDLAIDTRTRLRGVLESLQDVATGIQRFGSIANALIGSLRAPEPAADVVSVTQAIEGALALTRSMISRHAHLTVELSQEPLFVMASEGRLTQLLVNLLINAAQAVSGEATEPQVTLAAMARGSEVVVSVSDTGSGIAPELVDQIFKPFFTTKGRHGSGLGLAICRQVVDELQGTLSVESRPGEGTRFMVTLPRLGGEAAKSCGH